MSAKRPTAQELVIGNLMLKGLSNAQIAKKMGLTVKTVKGHITNILKANEVKTRYEFMAKVLEVKVTEEEMKLFVKILKEANVDMGK